MIIVAAAPDPSLEKVKSFPSILSLLFFGGQADIRYNIFQINENIKGLNLLLTYNLSKKESEVVNVVWEEVGKTLTASLLTRKTL